MNAKDVSFSQSCMFSRSKKGGLKIVIKSFVPGILAFIVATLLFCLPGQEFPEAGWLENLQIDKIVHVGLFAVLVVLWCLPIAAGKERVTQPLVGITIAFILYGIAIEFIQLEFIPHRSFDLMDIVADTVGSLIGLFVAKRLL